MKSKNTKLNTKSKEATTDAKTDKHCLPMNGVYGILMLFVFGSIAYSTYIVAMGVEGYIPKLMLVPQALFALIVAIYKFSK